MDNQHKSNNRIMNPWQNNLVPSTLSTGAPQLTEAQAQLALAITNLLRPQSFPFSGENFPDVQQSHGKFNTKRSSNRIKATKTPNHQCRGTDLSHKNDPYKNEQWKSSRTIYCTTVPELSNNNKISESRNINDNAAKGKSDSNNEDESQENGKRNQQQMSTDKKHLDNSGNKIEKSKSNNGKKNLYAGISAEYLKCSPCNKKMWDSESFEKHLRGHAHRQILENLEESFEIQADMMRKNIQLKEKRKLIELNRAKRLGKHVDLGKRIRCNMCDYDFTGHEATHRRSDEHQQLKLFLHPPCKLCNLEFPTRIEWEEHCLTPEHLQKLMFTAKNYDDISYEIEQLGEGTFIHIKPIKTGEESENSNSNEINDFNQIEDHLPPYDQNYKVGTSFITKRIAYICELCNYLFLTEESSEKHARSKLHFDNYIMSIKNEYCNKRKHESNVEEEKEKDEEADIDSKKIKVEIVA